jgi:hypothetical protein
MQSKRKVSFTPTVTVHPVGKLSDNEEDKSRLYYSRGELASITREVKAIIQLSKLPQVAGSVPNGIRSGIHNCIVDLQADFALRGLELYLYPARAMNKLLRMTAIMKYQHALNSDSSLSESERSRSLADMSTKLSRWSQEVAMETARLDSIRSYGDDYLIPIAREPEAKRRRVTCDNNVNTRS